jgi:hypothetical protein
MWQRISAQLADRVVNIFVVAAKPINPVRYKRRSPAACPIGARNPRVSSSISEHMYPPGEDRDSPILRPWLNSAMQAANVQTAVELSSLTGTKSVTLGTYLRGRTIPPLQKC